MNTATFSHSIIINVPLSQLFSYTTTLSNLPRWSACLEVESVDALPTHVGKQFRELFQIGSEKKYAHSAVTGFNPEYSWTYQSVLENTKVVCTYSFKSVKEGSTQMKAECEYSAELPKIFFNFQSGGAKRQLKQNLFQLKKIIEQ